MIAEPGFLRIRGTGAPGLIGAETTVDVQLGDGTWLPLRGVCSAKITLGPDAFVTAALVIEVGSLDLTGVTPDVIVWRDSRSRWRRLLAWVRRSLTSNRQASIARLTPTIPPAMTGKEIATALVAELDKATMASFGASGSRSKALEVV